MPLEYHKYVADVAANDVATVLPRDAQYQGSWQRRGGSGVFANLARKWDRIEAACAQSHYDLMIAFLGDSGPAGLIDDIRDLRRYLLLTEAWLVQHGGLEPPPARQDRPGVSQWTPQVMHPAPTLTEKLGISFQPNTLQGDDPNDERRTATQPRRTHGRRRGDWT